MSKLKFNQSMEDSNLSHINTEVIYPIAINQDTCTFNITNRGGSLDKHTSVVLPVVCEQPFNGDPSRQSFLPINVGIGSIIRSAQIIANGNGVVLCQNDNVGQWFALAHSFQQQEFRKKVLKCRHGIFENYEPSESGVMNLGGASTNAPGRLGICDMNYNMAVPQTATSSNSAYPNDTTGEIDSFDKPENTNYRIRPTSANTANLYIRLEELFPKLYNGLQLPIHLINAGVSLVLQFSKNGNTAQTNERVCMSSNNVLGIMADNAGAQAPTPPNCRILTDEVVLLTDYLVAQDNNQLAAQVMSPEGLTLNYGDLMWYNFFLEGPAAAAQSRNHKRDVFQLGASNQVIRQMYMFFNPVQSSALAAFKTPNGAHAAAAAFRQFACSKYDSTNCLKNIYASRALSYLPEGERIQIKLNQQNVFNQPLEHNGHKLHELQTAYGASLCVPQNTYEFTDVATDEVDAERYAGVDAGEWFPEKSMMARTASIQGWSCQNLLGNNHFVGINLQKPLLAQDGSLVRANLPGSGTRCGPTPINIEIDRLVPKGYSNDHRSVNVCLIVEKTLNIRMGEIMIIDQ